MKAENESPFVRPIHIRYRRDSVSVVLDGVDITNSISAGGVSVEFPEVLGFLDPIVTLKLHADVDVDLEAAAVVRV